MITEDLWRRELPRHANAVCNSYLSNSSDVTGIALMPLFLSCRAAIRAKMSVTAARVQPDSTKADELRQLARDDLAMAERLLDPEPPVLVAIGGFSGSGKSTLARALAPSVGRPPGTGVPQ
jgi:aminoglycoside phosphotransferase family enzyme